MTDRVSVVDFGRYIIVEIDGYKVASLDQAADEVSVYGVGDQALETFEVIDQ